MTTVDEKAGLARRKSEAVTRLAWVAHAAAEASTQDKTLAKAAMGERKAAKLATTARSAAEARAAALGEPPVEDPDDARRTPLTPERRNNMEAAAAKALEDAEPTEPESRARDASEGEGASGATAQSE